MNIAVASGKGGTGKTTVATSLALALSVDNPVQVLDCDVEAPNAHLMLKPLYTCSREAVVLVPVVDETRCNLCGICAEVCQYQAIAVVGQQVLVFPEMCHGCGSCALNCPSKAIMEVPHVLGKLEGGITPEGIRFAHGLLNIGEALAVPVISQLKAAFPPRAGEITIVDAPPGTSCPVVEAVRGADYVILVTEPTPFGLHDLKLAYELTCELNLPAGVIINRDGIGDEEVEVFCAEVGLPVLLRIPMDREVAAGIARGIPLVTIRPGYHALFREIVTAIAGVNL